MPSSSMKFEKTQTREGEPLWLDDPNVPQRFVIQRATNRFQCYQRDGSSFYSVGYALSRREIRRFMEGKSSRMMAEFGEDTAREKLEYPFAELEAWKDAGPANP